MTTARIWLAFALATIVFYAEPLFSSHASIHWDLADVSYPAQKYFAESIHAGKLPQWSPYLESGIPFLADPRAGAWYPLHWPFFLMGITPRLMVWELALHAFLALGGAFLLGRRLFGETGSAVVGALLYAWGGFFAGHASNLTLFEMAALLPWLLWAALQALEDGRGRWIGLVGMVLGFIVLAAGPVAGLSCVLALVCFTLASAQEAPGKRTVALLTVAIIGGFLLSALGSLPALELNAHAVHPAVSAAKLHFKTLATFIAADYYGVISGLYSGPDDIRQHYLYSGLLLVPLALAGIFRREKLWLLASLVVPALIYAVTPGFRGSAPMDSWFVVQLGLAMAAVSGVSWAVQRAGRPRLWIALLALSAVDLWYWNTSRNPLVYARTSFSDLYGKALPSSAGSLNRLWSAYVPLALGPGDGPLLSRTEVSFGTGIGELDRYADYVQQADSNPKLINGLAATQELDPHNKIRDNPAALPRAFSPAMVQFVSNRAAARAALAALDPAQAAVVEAPERALSQGEVDISIRDYREDFYRIHVNAPGERLLAVAVPFFPGGTRENGWVAAVDEQRVEIVPVNEALTGVFVPAGDHQITFQYRSPGFRLGQVLSGLGIVILFFSLVFRG